MALYSINTLKLVLFLCVCVSVSSVTTGYVKQKIKRMRGKERKKEELLCLSVLLMFVLLKPKSQNIQKGTYSTPSFLHLYTP